MADAARKLATAADLLAIPDEDRFHEVIDGELVRKATPSFEHGAAQAKLSEYVGPFHRRPAGGAPGGWWFATEVEIAFETHQVYRPDLAGWRRDRVPDRPTGTPLRVRPDWICEIRAEVPHYWIVDPMSERLRVHRWTREGYLVVLNAHRGERVRAEPFDAVELYVGELFSADDEGRSPEQRG